MTAGPAHPDRRLPRVVSLIPSGTEWVAALGYADALVGRSHECDYPPGVEQLPACTAPIVDATQSSGEIHAQVTEAQQAMQADADPTNPAEAASIYELDTELLDVLAPDVIVTQSQCEVCAVSLAQVEQAVAGMVRQSSASRQLRATHLGRCLGGWAAHCRGVGRCAGRGATGSGTAGADGSPSPANGECGPSAARRVH